MAHEAAKGISIVLIDVGDFAKMRLAAASRAYKQRSLPDEL
jgi:hypothetical protein